MQMNKQSPAIEIGVLPSCRSSKEAMLAFKKQCLKKHAAGNGLTLDETAFAIWDPETQAKPMSPMGILKIERRALAKLKNELAKYGIKNLDDVFDPKYREMGHQENTKEH